MAQIYDCTNQLCEYGQYLCGPGEAIEHLREKHKLLFIRRPQRPGTPDTHGNIWYCYACETKMGKDHRSFQSDGAMWRLLNHCHNHELDDIKLEK